MCLTIPGRIVKLKGRKAEVEIEGKKRLVDCAVVKVKKGDWVLVQADLAVEKVSEDEAKEVLKLFK